MNRYLALSLRSYAGRGKLIGAYTALATTGIGCAAYFLSNDTRIHLDSFGIHRDPGKQGLVRKYVGPPQGLEGVEAKLRQFEQSHEIREEVGFSRFDTITVPR